MKYGSALAALLAASSFATAQATTFDLSYTVVGTFLSDGSPTSSALLGTTGSLFATVPTSDINASGLSEFDPTTGLAVSVYIFGQTFTEEDDDFYDFNPFLRLIDGQPNYFEMTVSEISGCCGGNPTDIDDPRVLAFEIVGGNYRNTGSVITNLDVTATVVPLPAPLALLLSGLGALGVAGARRKRA